MIRALPGPSCRVDATVLLALTGAEPGRAVEWSATYGTITPLGAWTDGSGRAFAKYTPGIEGDDQVTVTYGADLA